MGVEIMLLQGVRFVLRCVVLRGGGVLGREVLLLLSVRADGGECGAEVEESVLVDGKVGLGLSEGGEEGGDEGGLVVGWCSWGG